MTGYDKVLQKLILKSRSFLYSPLLVKKTWSFRKNATKRISKHLN